MDPNNIQRHQYNTNPDSSYGAVFQLDTLVDVIPGLIYPAWVEVRVLAFGLTAAVPVYRRVHAYLRSQLVPKPCCRRHVP